MSKLWTICIPTLPVRIEGYSGIIKNLTEQITRSRLTDKIQIITLGDTKEFTVGYKRMCMLHMTVGDYVNFIDDDDAIADNYVSLIYSAIRKQDVDCATFLGEYVEHDKPKDFSISTKHGHDHDTPECLYRLPNHLCPIRTDIATQVGFPDMNYGEDQFYSQGINSLIKTEAHIKEKLYFYVFNHKKSQTAKTGSNTGYKD